VQDGGTAMGKERAIAFASIDPNIAGSFLHHEIGHAVTVDIGGDSGSRALGDRHCNGRAKRPVAAPEKDANAAVGESRDCGREVDDAIAVEIGGNEQDAVNGGGNRDLKSAVAVAE